MLALWPDYADTIPAPPWKKVTVNHPGGQAQGQLQPDGKTWAPLKTIAEASGAEIGNWVPVEKGGPSVDVVKKCHCG
jgi:hypothetical protein